MSTNGAEDILRERAAAVHKATAELTRAVNAAIEAGAEVEVEAHGKAFENGINRRVYHATVKKVTVTRY